MTNTHIDIAARRRSTEFRLVLMAGVITAGSYTLASLGQNSVIPPRILPFLAVLLLVLMSAHIGVRWLAQGADSTLLPVATLLNGIGYVMIARLSERLAGLQTTWTFVGVAAFEYVGAERFCHILVENIAGFFECIKCIGIKNLDSFNRALKNRR